MSAAFAIVATFGEQLHHIEYDWVIPNPLGFIPSLWVDKYFLSPWVILLPLLTILCVAALFVRYWRAATVEREQIKWLFYAAALFAAIYLPGFALGDADDNALWSLLFNLGLMAIPIAIGIAILRYRLFDIDIIIRRTLIYGLLTATLVAIYFAAVLLMQSAFESLTGQQSPLAIVISTLIIAALFAPLRRAVQSLIDRRFYRNKFDAQKVLAGFAQSSRDETDIETLTGELLQAVDTTLRPTSVSVWLRGPR